MIKLKGLAIKWANSAGIRVPKKYLGREATVLIAENPSLNQSFVYGPVISMECYGYSLLKPDNFAPQLLSLKAVRFNEYTYNGEKIKIMAPEEIILHLLESPNFKSILGIPVMLAHSKKIDFQYLKERADMQFIGYLFETTQTLLNKYNLNKKLSLQMEKQLKLFPRPTKTKVFTKEAQKIFKKAKHPKKLKAFEQDSLMKKWKILFMPSQRRFEEVFKLYLK